MKHIKLVFFILSIVLMLSNIGTANPGIMVMVEEPPSYTLQSDGTALVEYHVRISSLDPGYDTDGDGAIDCCEKTVTSGTILQDGWSESGWNYQFVIPTITIPADYGEITTEFFVTVPFGTPIGLYPHQLIVESISDLYIPDDLSTLDFDETLYIPGAAFDSMFTNFNTQISDSGVTPIPEFPTIALPIISVLGLLFLMRRRK